MKIAVLFILYLLIIDYCTAFSQPKILLDSAYGNRGYSSVAASINFGKVQKSKGYQVVRKFAVRFSNIGDSVLKILSRTYADGGVYAHYLRREIPKGQRDSMIVELESLGAWQPGVYHRSIRMETNDPKDQDFLVYLTWEVVPSISECIRDRIIYPPSIQK